MGKKSMQRTLLFAESCTFFTGSEKTEHFSIAESRRNQNLFALQELLFTTAAAPWTT